MKHFIFAIALVAGVSGLFPAHAQDAPVSVHILPDTHPRTPEAVHFAANVEYHRPGVYYGTLPKEAPGNKRVEFAEALQKSGLKSLRFPGGNCSYWYLWDSEETTRKLTAALKLGEYAPQNFANRFYTPLEDFLDFCREYDIEPILQLPTMFYNDAGTPHAILPSSYTERAPELFDRERLDEGAAYIRKLAAWTREKGFNITHWEIGNEEFAHFKPADYARIAVAFVGAVRAECPDAVLYIPMMHWTEELQPLLREAGLQDDDYIPTTHYPFGSWFLPGRDTDPRDPVNYVMSNMRFDRNFQASRDSDGESGLHTPRRGVTETSVIRFPNDNEPSWDPFAIIPSYAHALAFAYNWQVLLNQPECAAAVFHDLESTYFGLMKYDVYYDATEKRFQWIPPDMAERPDAIPESCWFPNRYVLSPTALAMGLLSNLSGCQALAVELDPRTDPLEVAVSAGMDKENIIVIVLNRGETDTRVSLQFRKELNAGPITRVEQLKGASLRAVLPGEFGIQEQESDGGDYPLALPAHTCLLIEARRLPGNE